MTDRSARPMKTDAKTAFLVMLAPALFCAGCSDGGPVRSPPEKQQAREFSQQEKRAAAALSINRVRSVTDAASPYARALLCKNGIDVMAQRLENSRVMSAQQRQLMQQAQSYFDRQMHETGERQGRSAADVQKDLEQAARDHSDAEENARIAVACLQQPQEEG